MEQRSPEWYQARCGKITASQMAALLGDHPFLSREDYIERLAQERRAGQPYREPTNEAMQHGIDQEANIITAALAARPDLQRLPDEGFVPHPDLPNCGASPDALALDADGRRWLIEAKAPQRPWREIYPNVQHQMQFGMWCCGCESALLAVWPKGMPQHDAHVLHADEGWRRQARAVIEQAEREIQALAGSS